MWHTQYINCIATIPESHDPYTTILTVSAMDPDEGPNGEVEYDLSSAPRNVRAKFRVDPKRGDLQLTEALDFESEKYYEFPIIARDLSKTNPRTSEATLQIYGARIARCCDYENKWDFNILIILKTTSTTLSFCCVISNRARFSFTKSYIKIFTYPSIWARVKWTENNESYLK